MGIGAYDPKTIEPDILKFWEREQVYEKARKKNKGKKKYYFLDGPPYTSGTVHIGTAWNKALKDLVLRLKRMQGLDVWDRAGYDMHGLPTEQAIRKKHNIFLKKDIEKFGLDKYNKECEQFAVDMMHQMNKTFERLGVWMDFENAYIPIRKEFIEGEWWLIKRAHEQDRLYEGMRTMPWCAHCETNMAKHELEYQQVKDESIFVKFRLKDKPNEFLIIWTTTPWTIPFNLAVMVNPDLDYVRVQVKDEVWILAKALAGPIVQGIVGVVPKVLETIKGEKLEGIEYLHPFEDTIAEYKVIKAKAPKTHTIVLSSEYVDVSAGSGLVHCAPGCGPEDYEVGHKNGIPAWNTIDEHGKFPKIMGEFSGLVAKKDDAEFVEALEKRKVLVAKTPVEHEYGHCQRCHNPVVFRTTKQWFFKVEDLKPKMIEINNHTHWIPKAAFNAFDSWLKNLRDNSITKQNFWGTPVPIWKCDKCEKFDVISTVEELEKKSKKKIVELHRPWIDMHEIECKCGGVMKRIPDILDVWVDAGTVSWNCLDYPQRKDLFDDLFPADFILEGKDQIRGWFNLLMVAGIIALDKQSFKSVYMHGFIQDAQGRKMSKSLGNYIEPKEVVDTMGADAFRVYTISSANPGLDLNYNPEDAKLKYKTLVILWNLHKYLLELASQLDKNPADFDPEVLETLLADEEKYIISKLNITIAAVTEKSDKYLLNEIPGVVEELFLALSRTYVQLVRDKAAVGSDNDKEVVLYTLYSVLLDTLKLFAPVAPFITEQMYLNLKNAFKLPEESIHLCNWPKQDKAKTDLVLEKQMMTAGHIIEAALAARDQAKLSVRWPLKAITVVTEKDDVKKAVEHLKEIIKTQVNTKEVLVSKEAPGPAVEFKEGKVALDITRTPELDAEGFAREIMRRVQALRKKSGLDKKDSIEAHLQADADLVGMLKPWTNAIKGKVGAKELTISAKPPGKKYAQESAEKVKGKEFTIMLEKA